MEKTVTPFLIINKLVNATVEFEYILSLDVMSGYHQILMDINDKEQKLFIIEEGTYCYKAILFILKNARVTY